MNIIRTAKFAICRSRRCDKVVNPDSHMMFSILLDRKAPRAILMSLWWIASEFFEVSDEFLGANLDQLLILHLKHIS
jgi:hypothetical protein